MSFVEVKNLEPTTFEANYYDEYEYYNLTDRYCGKTLRFVRLCLRILLRLRMYLCRCVTLPS